MKRFFKEVIKEMNKCKRIILIYYNLKFLEKKIIVIIRKIKEISLNLIVIEKIMKILINLISHKWI